MQIIDNKYRLFGVINLIDLVVVLAVLAGGYAVYRVLSPTSPIPTAAKGTKTVQYEVICPATRNIEAAQVKVGDTISKTTGKAIGKVTAVQLVPTPAEVWDPIAHKVVRFQSTIFSDIYITCTAQGQPTATGVTVGDLQLHADQPMPVFTSTFQCDSASISWLKIVGE